MSRSRKVAVVVLTVLFSFAVVQTVIAQGLGIDLIALAQQKAAALAGLSASSVNAELEQTRQETIEDTTDFIDQYIEDMRTSLDQYTAEELEAAREQLKAKSREVKDALNAEKQNIIDGQKVQIKLKVQEELNKKLDELESELSIKIKDKFK